MSNCTGTARTDNGFTSSPVTETSFTNPAASSTRNCTITRSVSRNTATRTPWSKTPEDITRGTTPSHRSPLPEMARRGGLWTTSGLGVDVVVSSLQTLRKNGNDRRGLAIMTDSTKLAGQKLPYQSVDVSSVPTTFTIRGPPQWQCEVLLVTNST